LVFFLEEVKVGDVVFDFVVVKIAEDAEAGLFILERKPRKSGVEFLNAGADGDEIIVGAEVVEFVFDEGFLQADVRVETICAGKRAGADDTEFADFEVVEANFGGDAMRQSTGLKEASPWKRSKADAGRFGRGRLVRLGRRIRSCRVRRC